MLRMYLPAFSNLSRQFLSNKQANRNLLSSIRLCSNNDLRKHGDLFFKHKSEKKNELEYQRQNVRDQEESTLWTVTAETFDPIKSFTEAKDVLEYLRNNSKIDIQLYAPIFNALFKLEKYGNLHISKDVLFRTKEIESLSRQVKKNARFMKVEDCVTILKVLLYFKISSNSILSQHLLQMISQNINKLDIRALVFTSMMIRNCKPSPLVDALKSGIPFVFETHVLSQVNVKDPRSVAEAVVFALRENLVSDSTKESLLEASIGISDQFEVPEAYRIVSALCYRHHKLPRVLDLYLELIPNLSLRLNSLRTSEVVDLVEKSLERYLHSDVCFYSESLVSGAINYFIDSKVDFRDATNLLRAVNKVSYCCPHLLDYIDGELKDMENLNSLPPGPVTSFITACSNCLHKPVNWPLYESKFLSYIEERKDKTIPLIRLVTDLIILKCWPTTLIEYCFSKQFCDRLEDKEDNFLDQVCMLNLYQTVRAFYPGGYEGPLLESETLQKLAAVLERDREYPLISALHQALGGAEYVLTGVRTKLGHLIDYLIVKHKSGRVFPVNPSKIEGSCQMFVESLELPEDSYIIGIVLMSPASYCLDGFRVRGKINMILRTLESLGIVVVPVSQIEWLDLKDAEKIPYLVDKINTSIPCKATSAS